MRAADTLARGTRGLDSLLAGVAALAIELLTQLTHGGLVFMVRWARGYGKLAWIGSNYHHLQLSELRRSICTRRYVSLAHVMYWKTRSLLRVPGYLIHQALLRLRFVRSQGPFTQNIPFTSAKVKEDPLQVLQSEPAANTCGPYLHGSER